MTLAKLERLAKKWQQRLRLQDWEVSLRLMTEAEDPETFGQAEIDICEMRAQVTIRDDDQEAEATLVHELLHLRLICFGVDDTDERQTAMNLLADSLVKAFKRPMRKGNAL